MEKRKGKTIAGKIIQSMIGTADQLLTGGNLSKVIGAITGNETLTAEDKDLAIKELNIILLDVQQARDANARIQESENASWLAKNTAYLLDLGVFILIIAMMTGLMFVEVPVGNKDLFNIASGSVLGYMAATWSFHRGTSQSSRDKDKGLLGKIL